MAEVNRCLAVYQKLGDQLVEEVQLSEDEFSTVRRLLGYDASDPMYDCYPIKGHALQRLLNHLGRKPSQDCEYFLESERA